MNTPAPGYERTHVRSGTPWEDQVGYSRAVRVGPFVYVAGTTATDESGAIVGVGEVYAQAVQALRNIERALQQAGAGVEHVVRTRTYITDASRWPEAGRAHSEFFDGVRPASTMVEVSALVVPEMLVEIEVDAVVPPGGSD